MNSVEELFEACRLYFIFSGAPYLCVRHHRLSLSLSLSLWCPTSRHARNRQLSHSFTKIIETKRKSTVRHPSSHRTQKASAAEHHSPSIYVVVVVMAMAMVE